MKNIYFGCLIIVALLTSCTDRHIIDSKEGESINPVTGLTHTVNAPEVVFNWQLPSSYPQDVIQPVSIFLTVYKDNKKVSTITLPDAPTTYTYTGYSSASAYRFIFKVLGDVDTDDLNKSKLRYSSGVVAVI
jgi:hypothetical protein